MVLLFREDTMIFASSLTNSVTAWSMALLQASAGAVLSQRIFRYSVSFSVFLVAFSSNSFLLTLGASFAKMAAAALSLLAGLTFRTVAGAGLSLLPVAPVSVLLPVELSMPAAREDRE